MTKIFRRRLHRTISPEQRTELRSLVLDDYHSPEAACAIVGVPIKSIPPKLMHQLHQDYDIATTILEGNATGSAVEAEDGDFRLLMQMVAQRHEYRAAHRPASTQAPDRDLSLLADRDWMTLKALRRKANGESGIRLKFYSRDAIDQLVERKLEAALASLDDERRTLKELRHHLVAKEKQLQEREQRLVSQGYQPPGQAVGSAQAEPSNVVPLPQKKTNVFWNGSRSEEYEEAVY